MSNQPPYYDPNSGWQNPQQGAYPPGYGQPAYPTSPQYPTNPSGAGYPPAPEYPAPPAYPAPPSYPMQQPGYGPPPGAYAQPMGYPQPGYGYPGMPMPQQDQGGGFAIAGLILGIIAIPAAIVTICDTPFIVLGIIFSILGRRSLSKRGMATAGLICSIIGLVLAIIIFAVGIANLNNPSVQPQY